MAVQAVFLQRIIIFAEVEENVQPMDVTVEQATGQISVVPSQRRRRKYRERVFRQRVNVFGMPADQVLRIYRFDVTTILYILEHIKADIDGVRIISTSLPPLVKLLCVLHFCATGSFQSVCALANGLSQPAFSCILTRVTDAVLKHTREFIKFPLNREDLQTTKQAFFAIAGFPNVVGCVDGTHINIVPPAAQEEVFRNRKRHHSLNVQMVCNADLIITHCFANFPGSAHDSFVLRNSSLPRVMAVLPQESGWLLGDSAYALQPWLLTPLHNPSSSPEHRYNVAHIKTRNTIERTFGVLKSRFRCLHGTGGDMLYSPPKVCKIILMCCVLHNIARSRKVPLLDNAPNEELDCFIRMTGSAREGESGRHVRNTVICNFFA